MSAQLLNTVEAAKFLGMSKAFLDKDRCGTARIQYIKVGSRAVRYRLSDLEAYLISQIRKSTSDKGIQS